MLQILEHLQSPCKRRLVNHLLNSVPTTSKGEGGTRQLTHAPLSKPWLINTVYIVSYLFKNRARNSKSVSESNISLIS